MNDSSISVVSIPDAGDSKINIVATIDQYTIARDLPHAIFREIAERIAARYVDEHFAEIAAQLDQNAIANLAVAEAGKKIAEEIRSRPTIIRQPVIRRGWGF